MRRLLLLLAVFGLLATACGTDTPVAEPTTAPTTAAPTTPATTPPTTPPPPPPPPPAAPAPEPEPAPEGDSEAAPARGAEGDVNLPGKLAGGTAGGPGTYASYVQVTDDEDRIAVEIPEEWSDVDGAAYEFEGNRIYDVRASTNLEEFHNSWDVPGVIVSASRDLAQHANEVTMLNEHRANFEQACEYTGREPYDDGVYTGQYDLYTNCGGAGTTYVIIGAVPSSRAFVIVVQVQIINDRDFEALERVIDSFVVTGAL